MTYWLIASYVLVVLVGVLLTIPIVFIAKKLWINEENITNRDILIVLLFGIMLLFVFSCGAPEVDKEEVRELPVYTTPVVGMPFSIDGELRQDPEFWGDYLDNQILQWQSCMTDVYDKNNVLNSNLFLGWQVHLVEGVFKCPPPHTGNCNGSASVIGGAIIIIAVYEEFEEREYGLCDDMTPALCEELSHTCAGSNEKGICLREEDVINPPLGHTEDELRECLNPSTVDCVTC
jgi:hypothetical protein